MVGRYKIVQIWSFLAVLVLLGSCLDAPEYSDQPSIKFKKLELIDVSQGADSLRLTFDFEDGEGNIGLRDIDVFPPFHPFYVIIDSRDSLVTLDDPNVVPPLYQVDPDGNGFLFSQNDNRPDFNCQDYYFGEGLQDTFYIARNEYHSNLYITFLKKNGGTYEETSIAKEFGIDDCNQVVENLRIPIFDVERMGKPTVGNFTYSYVSNGLVPFLSLDTFKIEFFIYDRALNKSNMASSPDFVLSDIYKAR